MVNRVPGIRAHVYIMVTGVRIVHICGVEAFHVVGFICGTR